MNCSTVRCERCRTGGAPARRARGSRRRSHRSIRATVAAPTGTSGGSRSSGMSSVGERHEVAEVEQRAGVVHVALGERRISGGIRSSRSSSSSSARSCLRHVPSSTSRRTTSPKRRWNTCSSIIASRSSASSYGAISRSELRVIRNTCQSRIFIPGKSVPRCAPITCSSGTNWFGRRTGTQRGRLCGTFTRAKCSTPVLRIAELHRERQRQVRDVRERMPRIDGERRQHREDVRLEERVESRRARRGQSPPC